MAYCLALSALAHVGGFSVEVGHERQQGRVDRRDVVREPVWQVDVGDRAALGAVSLRKRGQRTKNPLPAKTKLSPATTAAAIPTRLSVRPAKPA